MKKPLLWFFIIISIICFIPQTASANGPGSSPNNHYLLIDDYSNIVC